MTPIASMTIIKGNGKDIEVAMNGIVSAEIKRIRERELAEMAERRKEFEKEMEWMNMIKKQRNRLLEEKCAEIRKQPQMTMRERTRERIGFVLACLICWGEELGLIKYVGGDINENSDFE